MNDQYAEQLELGFELRETVPAPHWAWALEQESGGDQDRGWWGA